MYLQLSVPPTLQLQFYKNPLDIKSSTQCLAFFPLSSTLCLNLIIPNITPGGLFSGGAGGGLIHGRSFLFQKLVPECPGAYTRWDLLSEFYGICLTLKFNIMV